LVGIGSIESAQTFAEDLDLKKYAGRLTLVADETGAVTEALGCYRGWLAMDQAHKERYPQTDINPYVKLLGMVLGFGSPGTIGQVLYGYLGDISDKNGPDGRQWVVNSLLQGSEKGRSPQMEKEALDGLTSSSLRPFELATLRLQTGLHIVSNWGKLGPKDGGLCTRMGGTFVFSKKKECLWDSFDQGILCYADMEQICEVAGAAVKGESYNISPRKEARVQMRKERQDAVVEEAAEEEARLKAEEARLQAELEARLKAEEKVRLAEKEARLKAEEEVIMKADEEVKLKDEEEASMNAVKEARRHEQESLEKVKAALQAEQESKKLFFAKEMPKAVEVERLEEEPAAAKKQPRNTEPFQRKLLAARILADLAAKRKATQKPAAKVMNVAVAETKVEEPAAAKEQPRNTEPFQRKLLAARIQADLAAKMKATQDSAAKVMNVAVAETKVEEPAAAAKEQPRNTEPFQRKLLAARIQVDLAAKMTATQESGAKVMTVAAANTKVEEKPAAPTPESGAKISLLEEDTPPREDALLSRKKPKKKKKSSSQGFGFK
jgi:hypothetical protein